MLHQFLCLLIGPGRSLYCKRSRADGPPLWLAQYVPDAIETDRSAFRVPWYAIAFTRRREVFMGRLAMLGFVSENVGEVREGCSPHIITSLS